jgi:hypothetical protein
MLLDDERRPGFEPAAIDVNLLVTDEVDQLPFAGIERGVEEV